MKRLIIFLSIVSSFSVAAQDKGIVTEHFKVQGNCGMCKKRIENAAYIKGVKRAEWDKTDHELTLIYNSSKTTSDAILASVAKAGHESERVKVADADYKKLPECCAYKTNNCEH